MLQFVFSISCSRAVKSFAASTSTGNLTKHLSSIHNIVDKSEIYGKSSSTIAKFFSPVPSPQTVKDAKAKRKLVFDVVLLCCRDLLPFDIVEGEGFLDFCSVSTVASCKYCNGF